MRSGFSRAVTAAVLFIFSVFCLATSPEPTVGGIPLGNDVHARRRADSLKSLISRTKPTLVWSDRNMLWVDHDASGNPLFALNQAYQIDDESSRGSWGIFESDANYVATGFVDFTRYVTPGSVLAKDRKCGIVYLLEWPARHETGGGPVDSTRHILVFQTLEGKWHFIGEGPGSTNAHAQHKTTTTTTHYDLDWTQDPQSPVKIRATRSTHITFTSDDAQASIDSTHDFALAGPLPSRFRSTSTDYLESRYGDTLAEIALRVATCGTFYPLERTTALKSKMLENVTESLTDLNPKLSKKPRPGSRIVMPNLATLWDDANHAAGIKNHPSH
jgi:hypothetical protein